MTPISDLRYVERADVYKGQDAAGILIRNRQGIRFNYDPRYLQSGLPAIATSLPLEITETETLAGSLPTFFTNLLPEGVRLLALKDRLKTSLDDELSLLLAVGRDCVGDVSVVPEGDNPELQAGDVPSEPFDIDALFTRAAAAEDPHAIAGVQEKVSSDILTYPTLSIRGPAIVKFAPPKLPYLVRNEHFFMQMAAGCGVPAAETEIIQDDAGREALWVYRFDRKRSGDKWVRLAQEDGCQLADRYPADKYRLSLREISESYAQRSAVPLVAIQSLLSQVVFSYLIGNGDLHAKNLSLGETRLGLMPTPAYDIVSTLPYPNHDQNMALRMDGRDAKFLRKHFEGFFGRHGIPPKAVNRAIERIIDSAPPWIDRIHEIGFNEKTTEQVVSEIRSRRERLEQ